MKIVKIPRWSWSKVPQKSPATKTPACSLERPGSSEIKFLVAAIVVYEISCEGEKCISVEIGVKEVNSSETSSNICNLNLNDCFCIKCSIFTAFTGFPFSVWRFVVGSHLCRVLYYACGVSAKDVTRNPSYPFQTTPLHPFFGGRSFEGGAPRILMKGFGSLTCVLVPKRLCSRTNSFSFALLFGICSGIVFLKDPHVQGSIFAQSLAANLF